MQCTSTFALALALSLFLDSLSLFFPKKITTTTTTTTTTTAYTILFKKIPDYFQPANRQLSPNIPPPYSFPPFLHHHH